MPSDFDAVRDTLARQEPTFATLEVRGDQARVAPAVTPGSVYDALNEHHGANWTLEWSLEHHEPVTVRCRIRLRDHGRDGLAQGADLDQARQLALSDAVRAWGWHPDWLTLEETWVEYDPEEGANTSELAGETSAERAQRPVEPPRDPQLEKAKKHIDDLMDQLREQGRGKQASLVLVRHGGYGQNVEESRRVYAELKALLKS